MRKILLFGPSSKITTGQSFAFAKLQSKCKNAYVISYDQGLIGALAILSKLPLLFFRNKFDVLYFSASRTKLGFLRDLCVLSFAFLQQSKIVCHLHGADFFKFVEDNKFAKFVYQNVNTFILLDEKMKEQVSSFSRSRAVVVPNFYDLHFSVKKKPCDGVVRILYFSNLMVDKGILEFLKLIRIYANCSCVEFHIAGRVMGMLEERRLIHQELLNLKNVGSWSYHGVVHGNRKLELLARCNVMILPTVYLTEAQPISIIECLAAGQYVIATDQGYIKSLLSGFSAKILENNEAQTIVGVLDEKIKDGSLQDWDQINSQLAEEKFSLSQHTTAIGKTLLSS